MTKTFYQNKNHISRIMRYYSKK